MRKIVRAEPRTVVTHAALTINEGNLNSSVGRAPLDGVVEEIDDCARQAALTSSYDARLQMRLKTNPWMTRGAARDLRGDQPVEPKRLGIAGVVAVAGRLQKIFDEHTELGALLDEIPEQWCPLGDVEVGVAKQHLKVCTEAGDWRAQLM
jgi:hypothetical protein